MSLPLLLPVVVTAGAAARAGLSAGAPVRGRGRDPGVVRALRLGRARPGGGGPRALGRRSTAAARPPGSRKPGGVPRPARGARRRRSPARPGEGRALVRARDGGRAGRERPGRGGAGGRSRPRGARARADRPRAEGLARALLRRAARRLGRDPSGRGRRPRAALLDRVQPRGRRHAARPADGDLGSGGRHRARLRRGARRRGWPAAGGVPGQGPRDDGVRRATRGPASRPVRGHEEQHAERSRTRDPAHGTRPRGLLARRRLARGGDGRPPLDPRGLGGGGEARGPGGGRGRARARSGSRTRVASRSSRPVAA